MISPIKENNDRLFIISYYLSEDTIAVYELTCRNLGFRGGEFFGKSKFYLPGQDKYTSERPVAYKSQDLYLGAVVNLRNFIFKIVSADLFALQFMEENKEAVSGKCESFEFHILELNLWLFACSVLTFWDFSSQISRQIL